MATEADTAEAVSHTKREGEDTYLTTVQFETTSTESFLAEFNISEGQLSHQPEFKEFEKTSSFENRKDTIMSTFGTSEGGSFLEPLSAPKVANDKVSSLEHCQADELNQSEREMSENENRQQKGEQLGNSEEIRREHEQTEEHIKTAEQDHKSQDILKVMASGPQMVKTGDPKFKLEEEDTTKNNVTVEQQIEVISNQLDSSKESQHNTEEENKGSKKDEIQMEDKSTDLSSNEVLNGATVGQNGEASACDLIVNSFNKDVQSPTNACTKDGNASNTSSTDAIHNQEEFGEEGFAGVMNKEAEKSFDLAGEEKGPEAIGSSGKMAIEEDEKDNITVNSIENDSIPNVAASQEMQNDEEATSKIGEIVKEKLEMESVTESREQEARIEEEEKHKEGPTNAANIKIQETTESNERESDGALVDNEMHDKNITGSSEQEAGIEEEEKHKEALTTASNKKIQDTTVSEEPENAEDYKGLESTKLAGHPESCSLQQNEPEKKKLELNAIAEQLETAAQKDDALTTTCINEESYEHKITGKDLAEEQDNEKDAERLKEEESSTKIKKESSVNELSPEFIQEDSTATSNDEEYEAEKSIEEIVKESVTAGAGESISCEINENAERSVDVLSVKQDEGPEEEARHLSPMKASIEENRDDTLSTILAKDDEHNTVEATEKRVRVESKDKEDSEKALEKDEPGEKLEKLPHVISEETPTEPSGENASSSTCMKTEGTIQDLEETPKTEKKEEKTKDIYHTEGTVKEIVKESATAGAGESISCEINENVERSVDVLSVKQDEGQEEEARHLSPMKASIEENRDDTFSTNTVEATEKRVRVESKDKEDSEKALEKDEPGEKLEKLPHVISEETSTEPSGENASSSTCMKTEGTIQDLEETPKTEKKEEKTKDIYHTEGTVKEIVKESATAGAGESISCEINENVERSVDVLSVKQDEGQEEEARHLSPMKASIEENRDDTFSTNTVEATEKRVRVESKDKEDSEKALEKDEPGEKLEKLPHVISEETSTEPSGENASSSTCMKTEGTIQDLEETSKTEKKEEKTKDIYHTEGTVKEVLVTTIVGQVTSKQKLGEIHSIKDLFLEFTKERSIEENTKEDQELTGLETEILSTDTGKQNLEKQAISELYSVLTGKETVEDSSKDGENNPMNLMEENENKNSEPREHNEATDLTEETTTEQLEEEIHAEQSKRSLIQNSSFVSETHDKVIKEEIQDKGATILNSDTVQARILSEEVGLKEAESEDKDQVVCSDIAPEEKGLASNVDFEVQQEQKSNTEANVEEITAMASESGEQKIQVMEDKTPTPIIENEEKKATSETFLDDVPEDNLQHSSVVPSIENEAITTEASDQSEDAPARNETLHDNAKAPFTEPTKEEKQLLNKDESIQRNGVPKLESYDAVKETENEEIQRQMNQQLHMPLEQINDINSSELGDVGISKMEDAAEFAYKNEVSNLEILKEEKLSIEVSTNDAVHTCMDSEKTVLEDNGSDNNSEGSVKSEVKTTVDSEENTNKNAELPTIKVFETTDAGQETRESDSIKDYSPEFSFKEQPEGSTKEDEAIVGMETTPASTKIGKEELDEEDVSEISSSLLGGETIKEILKDDKNALMTLEEERKSTHLDSKEELGATDLKEETKYQILEENIEPNNGLYAMRTDKIIGQDSSFLSNVSEEVIEEEIQEKESTVYNSNSAVGIVSEETGLKKGELEDKEHVKGFTIEPEENSSAVDATLDVKPEENSSTEENREEILTAAYDAGEKIEKMEENMDTGTEEEKKITTMETSSHDMHGDYLLTTETKDGSDEVTNFPEETKRETLEDSAGPNKDLNATITTKALEEEKITEQSNKNFVQNSSSKAEVCEKVFEDAIQDKGPVICNSNSVSAGIVIEKTCLQEVEPENEEQVRNFDIALEEKGLESCADIEIQQEKSSNPEENGEKQIPANADKSGKEIEHEMEDDTSVRIESEEKNTTSETLLDSIPEDNLRDSYTVSSIVNEPMTTGASDVSEETPPREKNLHEDAKTPTIDPPKDALQLLKEDKSILLDDIPKLESYDIVKGFGNEEIQKQRDQQLHKPHEHINDINSSESGDVAISKIEEATDFACETEVSRLEILKDEKLSIEDSTNIAVGTCMDIEKPILEYKEFDKNSEGSLKGEVKTAVEVETNTNKNDELQAEKVSETTITGQETREMDRVKDYSPEFVNKEQPEGNTEEDKVLDGMVTAPSSTKIGKQDGGEQESSEISSSLLGGETAGEILKDDKNAQVDLEEKRKDAHSYSKEQLDVKLEKNLEPYKDLYDMRTVEATDEVTRAEECSTVLVPDSSFVSEVSEKLIEEEIQETEPSVYSSNSLSAGTVSGKTGLMKDELEDGEQVKSCTIAPEEKGSAHNPTIDVKPEEKFKEENREEILMAANKIEESFDAGTEEEKKKATSKTSTHDILEVDLSTTEATKSLDETLAGNKVTDLTEETKDEIIEDNAGSDTELYATTTTGALKEEKTADQSHKTVAQNSSIVAEVSEEVIQKEIQDNGSPIFNSDSVSTGLVIEETDLKEVEQENKEKILSSDISPEEKGLASIVDIEMPLEKNSNLEENEKKEIPEVVNESGEKIEHKMGTDKNFEAGLSGAEVVKEAGELKEKNTKNNELQREENLESAYPGQVIAYTSESVTQEQIEETLPRTPHTESEPVEQQVVAHGELETQMETEPRMKAEDQMSKIDCTNETIKAVILTEEHEEIEKSENPEGQVTDGESNLKSHPVDETTYEEKESSAVFGECIKEQDANEPTPSMNSQSEEDIITEKRETSVTKAPDEEKIQDEESTKPVDVCNAVAEEGKYEEEIKEDSATVTGTTTATNFDDTQLVNKPVEEETKTTLDVEVINETRPTLANETEKEVDEPPRAVSPSESQSITAITKDEIFNDQALPTGIPDEQLHAKPSTFFAEEQKRETTTTIKELEEQSTKEVGEQDIEDVEDSSATHLLKEEHRELKVSELAVESLGTNETEEDIKTTPETVSESGFQSLEAASRDEVGNVKIVPKEPVHGTVPTIKTRDEENKKEVDLLDNEDSSAAHLLKEEHEELNASELAVERPGTNETLSESDFQSIEATRQDEIVDDKIVPAVISNTSKEACIEKEEPKELKLSDVNEEIPGADETEEEIKDASKIVSHSEKIEVVTDEKIITDQTFPEEISKEQPQVPSSTLLPREQEDETIATTNKVEGDDKKEVEILGNVNIVDYSSPKIAEDISLEKDGHTELKVSEITVAMLGADEIEEKFNEFDTVSENNSSNIEVLSVDKDETIIDQALPAELSPKKVQLPLSTLLPNEQEHDSTTTIEKTEENIKVVTETSNLNIDATEIPSDFVSEKVQNHGEFTETEDTEKKNNSLEVAKFDLRTEENRSEMTNEANETIKNEILDEEIKVDKQVTDDSQPVSLGENVQESHQETVSNSEHQGEKMEETLKASTNGNQPELSEVDEKGNASGTIKELITDEARSVKDHEQLSIEDKTIEENSPDEAEEKNVKEEAKNLEHENQRDEINFKNITTDVTSTREKEPIEISSKESILSLKEADEVTSEIKQLEKSSHATLEKESSREEDHNESTPTRITTGDKDAPPMLPDPIEETTHRIEPKETELQKDTWVDTEIKGEVREVEKETGESGEKTTETASTKISISDLIQSSTKQTKQVTEEKEAEAEHGEAKKDDEEGEDHKGSEPEGDAPVMVEAVEASRDADVKVAHKKSHNILSGVGSKVKHSISKVKKAITGKSSHSKQANKKPDDPSS